MSQLFKIKPLLLLVFLASLFIVEACKKDDDTDSDQIQLLSFGPSPVLRGGDLRFIGTNLDKVTSIVLANNVEVNTFKSKTAGELVIVVPEATVNGKVVLKTPQGDIQAKTELKISEPITITSFSPAAARPGAVISIEGTYLNLIKEVIFTNKKVVKDSAFISHTKEKIEVKVPDDAKTGIIIISNGEADPILVESATELVVTLPTVTQVSPTPVKAGTALTIEGTDLDLTREVTFTGGSKVTSFTSISGTQLVLNVPADAKDGPVKLSVASLEEVTSTATVVMSVPTINTISPAPAKTGGTVTVSGVDLDLVTRVTFGGDKVGAIQSTSATELTVNVPADAQDGSVTFSTAAGKTVTSNASLTMVKPTIGTISPTDIQVNNVLTITGNDKTHDRHYFAHRYSGEQRADDYRQRPRHRFQSTIHGRYGSTGTQRQPDRTDRERTRWNAVRPDTPDREQRRRRDFRHIAHHPGFHFRNRHLHARQRTAR